MKIFIAGATGRVGQMLLKNLISQGHYIYAGSRKPEQIEETVQVQPVYLDLHGEIDDIAGTLADAEIVYFVAGSRGKDLLQTDLHGAVKMMQATERKGIKRYVQLSSIFALEPERWKTSSLKNIMDYNVAKFFSDRWLIDNTALDYTILQPGSLEETPGTGKISVNVAEPGGNSIEDVAAVLSALIEHPNTIGKVVTMHSGETLIDVALKAIDEKGE